MPSRVLSLWSTDHYPDLERQRGKFSVIVYLMKLQFFREKGAVVQRPSFLLLIIGYHGYLGCASFLNNQELCSSANDLTLSLSVWPGRRIHNRTKTQRPWPA